MRNGTSVRTEMTALAAALLLCACGTSTHGTTSTQTAARDDTPLRTERDRISYTVGLDMARTLPALRDEVDIETVIRALRAAHAGREPALDAAQAGAARATLVAHLRARQDADARERARANRREGDVFLARNAKAAGVQVTMSGLQYKVLRQATGAKPRVDDTVRVNYVAKLLDGRVFESTYATDHPAELVPARVMPGLREALPIMPAGSKYALWLPASLAYGDSGVPGTIEPGSTLYFEVELLEIAPRA